MSLDKSLKTGGALAKHHNVLSRAARIARMQEEGNWKDDQNPFGLLKLANRKAKVGGKAKKTAETAAAPGAETAPTSGTGTAPTAPAATTPAPKDKPGKDKGGKKEKGKGKDRK